MSTVEHFTRMFEPITEAFTPELARKIADIRPDAELLARIELLGLKANDGTITPDEAAEYRDYIDAGDIVSILRIHAKRFLASYGC